MNYKQLTDAATLYADRQDAEVKSSVGLFILLAEARINRVLKTREQSTRAYTPTITDAEYYPLPPDYRGMRDVQINSKLSTIEHGVSGFTYLSPDQMNIQRSKEYAGVNYYTIIANRLQIHPRRKAGQSIELVYYQKVPNLTSDDDENWLSVEHPDIYLAGITAEISLFAKDYDAAGTWHDRMSVAIDELDTSDVQERWSGTSLYTRAG